MRPGRLVLALGAGLAIALPALADTLDDIQRRGALVVGVKRDVPLWGQYNPGTGTIEGLEPDLAADLARRLGVSLRLVGMRSAGREAAVESGQVDAIIATLSETPEREQRLRLVAPRYYASGTNVLARKAFAFRAWSDLRNRRVCGRRGAFYNRPIMVSHGIDIVALYSNNLGMAAVRDGRCDALLYDDTSIIAMLQEPRWAADFESPLKTLHPTAWAIALHPREAGGRWDRLVSDAVVDWHRSGRLLALERKWGIPPSPFAVRMNQAWSRREGGRWWCGEGVSPSSPKECL